MPRSFQYSNRWTFVLFALVLMAPLFVTGLTVEAQKRKPAQTVRASASADASQPQKKNLTRLNTSETAEGSSITIFSDMPLNDYSAYRGGDRFYVLIPGADASRVASGLRGRGFADVRTQQRGNDVLVSFRLLVGASARVSQKFNRLEILITVPALVAANAAANTNNSSSQTSPDQSRNSNSATNSSAGTAGSRGQRGNTGSQSNTSAANPNSASSQGPDTFRQNSTTTPDTTNPSIGPDGQVTQSGSDGFPPVTQVSPEVSPTVDIPADQVAQVQPTPGIPGTTSQVPSETTAAPSAGTSFGAQLRQNWLFVLLAVAVAGLIAWVLFARSRADQDVVEHRVESIRDPRPEPVAVAAPLDVEAPPLVEPVQQEFEVEPLEARDVVEPAIVAAAADEEVLAEPVEEPVEAKEIEPLQPVAVELASSEVAGLLAGNPHDEVIISTQNPEARQIIAAELLAALTGRNIIRNERARDAFIRYGYFDDATRTLRTADSPGERASAARSLGLVRDNSATPHLVAALEDRSPEVRRAAVESLAEVRDPSAVASLEAMRDREKNRKVPITLIQRAIEASVVGRARIVKPPVVEPSPEPAPPVLEPESIVEVEEPPVEAASVSTDEVSAPVIVPEASTESIVIDEPVTVAPVQDEVVEQRAMPELETEPAATTPSEWVDVDVSHPSDSSLAEQIPSAASPVEEVILEDSTGEVVKGESPAAIEQPTAEVLTETTEPPSLPFGATEAAIIAGDVATSTPATERGLDVSGVSDKEIDVLGEYQSGVPGAILRRLGSEDTAERAAAVEELATIGGDDSFREICGSFDDPSPDVRNAAARALFSINPDRAASFTRALREASPERRRHIGSALSSSGLATEAIGHLMGESREKTYDAFSLLFLMSKAGEVQPLMRAVEEHPNNEVRLAVVKLLALSGQHEILPAFRRLAVRGSLPTEVRSAVMEAIYQISSQAAGSAS